MFPKKRPASSFFASNKIDNTSVPSKSQPFSDDCCTAVTATPQKRKKNSKNNDAANNAFLLMMSSNKKKKRGSSFFESKNAINNSFSNDRSGSRFVLCPAGCGKHVSEMNINHHLDICCGIHEEKQQQQQHSLEKNGIHEHQCSASSDDEIRLHQGEMSKDGVVSPTAERVVSLEQCRKQLQAASKDTNSIDVNLNATETSTEIVNSDDSNNRIKRNNDHDDNHSNKADVKSSNNVFAYMMKRSSTVFAKVQQILIHQELRLEKNGEIALISTSNPQQLNANNHQGEAPNRTQTAAPWIASVKLKDHLSSILPPKTKSSIVSNDGEKGSNAEMSIIELTISSYIFPSPTPQPGLSLSSPPFKTSLSSTLPSSYKHQYNNNHRLVRKHSKLSIPVLKSILQKLIRRRRPLPAVRVSMELIDRSCGELLRRLPIIILEDSFLHPELPFLVWLMMAHSKNYFLLPPHCLLRRVLHIIYQVASCPYLDGLHVTTGTTSTKHTATSTKSVSNVATNSIIANFSKPNDNTNNDIEDTTGNHRGTTHLESRESQDGNTLSNKSNNIDGEVAIHLSENNEDKLPENAPPSSSKLLPTQAKIDDNEKSDSHSIEKRKNANPNPLNNDSQDNKENQPVSSSDSNYDQKKLIVWSMLARAEYGGMACDVTMLHQFARIWTCRFFSSINCDGIDSDHSVPSSWFKDRLPDNVVRDLASRYRNNGSRNKDNNNCRNINRKTNTNGQLDIMPIQWLDVLYCIHNHGKKQGERVDDLFSKGIEKLTIDDICMDGIDFHCSNILDTLFSDKDFISTCCNRLEKEKETYSMATRDTIHKINSNLHDRASLESLFKKCMWKYSGSINHRRVLGEMVDKDTTSVTVTDTDTTVDERIQTDHQQPSSTESSISNTATVSDTAKSLEGFWNDLVAPRLYVYRKKYVEDRLNRS